VLFTKLTLPLEQAAERIIQVALPTYIYQLRDGLNIGGGSYIRFAKDDTEIMLVCNDEIVAQRISVLLHCLPRIGRALGHDALEFHLQRNSNANLVRGLGKRASSPGLINDAAQLPLTLRQQCWCGSILETKQPTPCYRTAKPFAERAPSPSMIFENFLFECLCVLIDLGLRLAVSFPCSTLISFSLNRQ
jgi:hypothetical protein